MQKTADQQIKELQKGKRNQSKEKLNQNNDIKLAEVITNLIMSIIITILVILVFTMPFMWLWNWLMPSIFGLTTINYWESIGLLIFSNIIFKK